jgi:hypothetical protein
VTRPEIDLLTPRISLWHAFDPALKADLFSTAILTAAGPYIIDPIPLPADELLALVQGREIAGIIVTNANHARSAPEFSMTLSVPIFAHSDSFAELEGSRLQEVSDGAVLAGELRIIGIPGAGGGEIALYDAEEGGTIVVGDALINFEPYGFNFLPPKYCEDEERMRTALRKLLDLRAQRLLFAHGIPISKKATERLRQLLEGKQ